MIISCQTQHICKEIKFVMRSLLTEREEKERLAQEEREREEREYAEKLAKLEAQAERQRQREREVEERQRQKLEETLGRDRFEERPREGWVWPHIGGEQSGWRAQLLSLEAFSRPQVLLLFWHQHSKWVWLSVIQVSCMPFCMCKASIQHVSNWFAWCMC